MRTQLAENLANQFRRLRLERGMTQAEVAVSAGVTVETVARLERVLRGKPSANANPSLETLDALAGAVGCSVVDLLTVKRARRPIKDTLDLAVDGLPKAMRFTLATVAVGLTLSWRTDQKRAARKKRRK